MFILSTDPAKFARIESQVQEIAAAQFGIATRKQLLLAGVGVSAINYRLRTGRLRVVHPGVYAVGYERHEWISKAAAAVLACGRDAVLSHSSAAALFEIRPQPSGPVDVSSPRARHVPNVHHHRRRLGAHLVTAYRGLRVTTLPRTLLDLAGVLDERALTRAVNEARVRHGTRPEDIELLLGDIARGQRGAARLRRLVLDRQTPTRSLFEDKFLAFVARNHLPRPEVNRRIVGHEVDMVWREKRLVVELDGWRYHDGRDRFERDRVRDADLLAAGYRVLRITWRRLTEQPAQEARRLRSLLR